MSTIVDDATRTINGLAAAVGAGQADAQAVALAGNLTIRRLRVQRVHRWAIPGSARPRHGEPGLVTPTFV